MNRHVLIAAALMLAASPAHSKGAAHFAVRAPFPAHTVPVCRPPVPQAPRWESPRATVIQPTVIRPTVVYPAEIVPAFVPEIVPPLGE